MTRTDIHRPSAIIPADYEFVSYDYTGELGDWQYLADQRQQRRAHMARTGGRYSNHEHGGSCHICGAHALYTATFWHRPTNVYVHTGLECADAMDHDSGAGERFRRRVAEERVAQRGVRLAKETLFAKFADREANRLWGLYNRPYERGETIQYEETTIRDIVNRLVRYGNISDRAIAYLGALLTKIDGRETIAAERAAAQAAALPVPTGKVTVRGKILSLKTQEGFYGITHKMLVQHADGWKVWGTVPSAIAAERGAMVEFTATVERSPDDEKFGFYKRPTKARILEESEA